MTAPGEVSDEPPGASRLAKTIVVVIAVMLIGGAATNRPFGRRARPLAAKRAELDGAPIPRGGPRLHPVAGRQPGRAAPGGGAGRVGGPGLRC